MKKAGVDMPFDMAAFKSEIDAKMKEFEANIQASKACLELVEKDF